MVLVLLPGFLGSSKDWEETISYLPFQTLPLNLPASIDDLFEQTKDLKEFDLLGYSMGGRIALQFKAKYSEKVRKLILLSTHLGLDLDSEKEKRLLSDQELALCLMQDVDQFLNMWYDQPLFASLKKKRDIVNERKQIDVKKMAKYLVEMSLGKQQSFWNQIPSNTSFILGEFDEKYRQLYENIPHRLILNAGHAVHLEEPKMTANAILEIIK